MNKLRTILAAALLALPFVALNASTVVDEPAAMEIGQPQQQAGCCWILIMGRWYCYYCGS
jgi:hypothetical protein